MNIVVDANVVVALVLPLPFSDRATQRMIAWKEEGVTLVAPMLFEYEISTIMRKAVAAKLLPSDLAKQALDEILTLNIQCAAPDRILHELALDFAEQLGQSKTYDAHYLALAKVKQAELWTADRRLANGSKRAGIEWVRWIGEPPV